MIDIIFGSDPSAELSAVEQYLREQSSRRVRILRDLAAAFESCFMERGKHDADRTNRFVA